MTEEVEVKTPSEEEKEKLRKQAIFDMVAIIAFGLMSVYYANNFFKKWEHIKEMKLW